MSGRLEDVHDQTDPQNRTTKKGESVQTHYNMLPTVEKVLELVANKQLDKYLESNNIITEHQSGFRNQNTRVKRQSK